MWGRPQPAVDLGPPFRTAAATTLEYTREEQPLSFESFVDAVEITDLLTSLIRLDTSNPPGNEQPVADRLESFFLNLGLEVERYQVAPGRSNLLVRWRGEGRAPALVFSGHFDVVPARAADWRFPPFAGVTGEGRLFGRGTTDMKSGVAAIAGMLAAAARSRVRLPGDLVFAGTVGEEVDCAGALHFAASVSAENFSGLVIAEPTHLRVARCHKGALWLRVETVGKAAHGSMIREGYNAIVSMQRVLERILAMPLGGGVHPLLGESTLNIGTIQGGMKVNIVADSCEATLDLRTLPGQSHLGLVSAIDGILRAMRREDPRFSGKVEVVQDRQPVETDEDHGLVTNALRAAAQEHAIGMTYFTDASVLASAWRLPCVILGPGDPRLAHQVDESVELAHVAEAGRIYCRLAEYAVA